MFLIRKYIDQIQSRQLKDIQEVIEREGVDTRLIRYFKAFKKSNDLPTCRNLSEVFKVIIEKGYYYEHEFLQKYDDDFFIKLLDDVEVYLFLFIYFFFSNRLKKEKTIFHYQKERTEVADDLDDLVELGIQGFKPATKGAFFLFDMGHYYILIHDKTMVLKINNILLHDNTMEINDILLQE